MTVTLSMKKRIKRINRIIALVIFTGAIFFSCEEEDLGPMTNNSQGLFTASVGGNDFDRNTLSVTLFTTDADSTLEIVATDNTDNIITLTVNSLEIDSYDVRSSNAIAQFRRNVGNGVTVSENTTSGTINISSVNRVDNTVSGSFFFETENTTISNGVFTNLIYSVE